MPGGVEHQARGLLGRHRTRGAERPLQARRPAVERPRPRGRAQRVPGDLDPGAGNDPWRVHRDGPTGAVGVPAGAQPVPLPRRGRAVGAAHRRLHPGLHRRGDRDRSPRLRRRLRQHRARGAHHGDAGAAARRLGDLLRARPHAGVHGARQPQLRPHARDDVPHGRATGRVRADPQDRTPSRHDHRAPQRQGDGRVPARRGDHRHRDAADRRRLRHDDVAARRRARLARHADPRSERGWSTTPTT